MIYTSGIVCSIGWKATCNCAHSNRYLQAIYMSRLTTLNIELPLRKIDKNIFLIVFFFAWRTYDSKWIHLKFVMHQHYIKTLTEQVPYLVRLWNLGTKNSLRRTCNCERLKERKMDFRCKLAIIIVSVDSAIVYLGNNLEKNTETTKDNIDGIAHGI